MSNELQLQTGPYRTTYIGTEVVRKSTKKEWTSYGEILRRVDEAKQWAIGDWLNDGDKHYGDGRYQEAAQLLGLDEQTLRVYASLSDQFQLLIRNQQLSHAHYRKVASLKILVTNAKGKLALSKDEHDTDKQQELLAEAEKEGWTVAELGNKVAEHKRRQEQEIALYNEPEKYSIILADPAWEYDFSRSDSRQIDNQYAPSSVEEMGRPRSWTPRRLGE